MRKLTREIFFLRKGERRALYIVLLILCLSVVSRIYMVTRPMPVFEPDRLFVLHMEEMQRKIDSALEQQQRTEAEALEQKGAGTWRNRQTGMHGREEVSLTPVPFNPNTVSYDTLVAMNLSGYVSRNIISYRNAGGTFRESGDLQKIYGLTEADYQALLPFILLPVPVHPSSASGPDDSPGTDNWPEPDNWAGMDSRTDSAGCKKYQPGRYGARNDSLHPLELNAADSAGLIALPGIGPWFAGRIIRYRELLGGFVHPDQLLEVYGMDTVRFNRMVRHVTVDTAVVRRIDLNNSSFQEIISHPYINREETYAIFRYIDFVDSIRNPENLLKDQVIDHERFMRMSPYLTVGSTNE
ncbi:MAG: helix-hairpin-helix domain-containing protein [Bacteroidales bacterium]|nr:helix-hairpin-helix domain-containing protein [Bacteroidales bacterium]MDT8431329.1 helix-hairpin-helix domain-containing protein [Bacteroidales bacterium]